MFFVVKVFIGLVLCQFRWFYLLLVLAWRRRLVNLLFHHLALRFMERPHIVGISISWNSNPGHGPLEQRKVCWEAPLGITFWGADGPLFAVGIELHRSGLYLRQLQGVAGATIPPHLRDWPRRVVKECISFSRRARLPELRLCRAHVSLFYHVPYFGNAASGETWDRQISEHRRRMRRRYDGTARSLKLRLGDRWAVWQNPRRALS